MQRKRIIITLLLIALAVSLLTVVACAAGEDANAASKAVCTYCAFMFGNVDNADQLKRVYDEQKAQLSMHTGHTDWLEGGE